MKIPKVLRVVGIETTSKALRLIADKLEEGKLVLVEGSITNPEPDCIKVVLEASYVRGK